MKVKFSRVIVISVACVLYCTQPGQVNVTSWKRVLTLSDNSEVLQLRAEGVQDLVVYAGRSGNFYSEIEGAGYTLNENGWNAMTVRPAADKAVSIDGLTEFLKFAATRPGIRKKTLIIFGAALPTLLQIFEPGRFSALVIIRPGDAGVLSAEDTKKLGEIGEDIPVFFLASANQPEQGLAYFYYKQCSSKNKEIRVEPALGIVNTRELFQGRLLTFLARLKYQSAFQQEFIEARKTFTRGCRLLPAGPWIYAYVSGYRSPGFCPMFLNSSGEIFRALSSGSSCDYGIGSQRQIRCL